MYKIREQRESVLFFFNVKGKNSQFRFKVHFFLKFFYFFRGNRNPFKKLFLFLFIAMFFNLGSPILYWFSKNVINDPILIVL